MRRYIRAAVLGLGLAAMTVPQVTAAQEFRANRIVDSIEAADLTQVVQAMGHRVEAYGENGDRSLRAVTPNGLQYFLIGTACDQGGVSGCRGVIMQVRVEAPERTTLNSLLRASDRHAPLNIWVNQEARIIGFSRYVVLDGGVTMGNLAANLNVLLGLIPSALQVAGNTEQAAAQ